MKRFFKLYSPSSWHVASTSGRVNSRPPSALTWGALALRFGSKRALFERALAPPQHTSRAATEDDLAATLRRLRDEIEHRWPKSMQLRLSSTQMRPADSVQIKWLAPALQLHADRGQIKPRLPMQDLATLLVATFTGAAAEGLLSRRSNAPADDAMVEMLLRLLS